MSEETNHALSENAEQSSSGLLLSVDPLPGSESSGALKLSADDSTDETDTLGDATDGTDESDDAAGDGAEGDGTDGTGAAETDGTDSTIKADGTDS